MLARRRRSVAPIALALVLALLACHKSETYTRTSVPVTAPAGSRWQRATASILFEPAVYGVNSDTSEQVTLRLTLDSSAGPRALTLDEFLADAPLPNGKPRPGDTAPAVYRQMKDPKFRLEFAPDGHALALSVDGGKEYHVLLLDTPDPLYCAHAVFSLAAGWSAAPKTRDLVLDVLASTDPPSSSRLLHLEPGEHPRGRERFLREFRIASAYAAEAQDSELQKAVIAALLGAKSPIHNTTDIDALVSTVQNLVRQHTELQAELTQGLASGPSDEGRSRAAMALADSKDPAVQEALAKALAKAPVSCTGSDTQCLDRNLALARYTWALAKVSYALGSLSDAARDALIAASRSEHPALHALAARGLALGKDARSLARLRELTEERCDSPLPSLSEPFPPFAQLGVDKYGAGCWAKAGLKAHDTP